MAIKTGRYGTVKWSTNGSNPESPLVELISLNAWKLSLATDYEDVTCFGDTNKVYIPGMRDISGTVSGFWNSAGIALVEASESTVPGFLELEPNSTEPGFAFGGPAYLDADLDCSVNGAPKLTGNFRAAGQWTVPTTS